LFISLGLHEFEVGRGNLYQTLLVKADKGRSGLPLTRADWYIV
jgi:cyclopropane-fatty-acyl-phospholipid synthase